MTADPRLHPESTRSSYYFWMSVWLLGLVLVGFGSAAVMLPPGGLSDLPAHLHVHGAILLAWYIWLVLQTAQIRRRRIKSHQRLGQVGMLLGGLCVLAGPLATFGAVSRFHAAGLQWHTDMREFPSLGIEGVTLDTFARMLVFGNLSSAFTFGLFLALAYRCRRLAEIHKRLLILASIELAAPAAARVSRWPGMGGEDGLVIPVVMVVMLVTLPLHDWLRERRIATTTWGALAGIVVIKVVFFAAAATPWGQQFVHSLA